MSNAESFRELVRDNPNATFNVYIATCALFAVQNGFYMAELHHQLDPRWTAISRRLRDEYGESLTADELVAEMAGVKG